MSQDDNPSLTITLTGRQPVKIKKEDWPIIASAEDKCHDGQVECQANRTATWKLIVRQHADGRTLVYGIHKYHTQWKNESSREMRGGELLDTPGPHDVVGEMQPIIDAIQRVGAEIESRLPESGCYGSGTFPRLVHECIADLPAEELV